jgi:aspartyl-tRNA(Asn)/glutamyl-tRNA(Gln) amidotransferase subunit A
MTIKSCLSEIEKKNKDINAMLYVNPNVVDDSKDVKSGKLKGMVLGIKANINVKGMPVSCASKTLENYSGSYDATVIEKIKNEGGVIVGMCNMDEFASGSSGENSAFGFTKNPAAPERIPGGSSSGPAAAVAAGFCDVSLGSDTGGSIRNPASHCGVVGFKPSYGAVSRYGLVDLSMNTDCIGPIGKTVSDVRKVFDVIKGDDDNDTRTLESKAIKKKTGKIKLGVLRVKGVDSKIQEIVDKRVEEVIKANGWSKSEVELKYLNIGVQTYYLIVYTDLFSASRRFDGRRYGKKIEDSCGEEVLRRILGGSEIAKAEYAGQYYEKALKVKGLIANGFEKSFSKVDVIISPVTPSLPWKLGEGAKMSVEEVYAADLLTVPGSLAGICSCVIPAGSVNEEDGNVPVGLQVMCAKGEDDFCLDVAERFEDN